MDCFLFVQFLFSTGHGILALLWTASIILIQVGCQSWIKYCNRVYQDLQKTEYFRLQVCFHRPHDTDADYSLSSLIHYDFGFFSKKKNYFMTTFPPFFAQLTFLLHSICMSFVFHPVSR